MVEVYCRILWVDEVRKMVEVGGKVIEIDDVDEEVPHRCVSCHRCDGRPRYFRRCRF